MASAASFSKSPRTLSATATAAAGSGCDAVKVGRVTIELIAEAALGAQQADVKRELTAEQTLLEKRLINITALLKTYNPDITLEVVKAIPLEKIGLVAMVILFLKPAMVTKNLKEEAVGAFFSDPCFLTRNRSQYVECYKKFWKACNKNANEMQTFETQLKDALELFSVPDGIEGYIPPAPLANKQQAQKLIVLILNDYCRHLEIFWKETNEFLATGCKDYSNHIDTIAENRRDLIANVGIPKKDVNFETALVTFKTCIPLLNAIKFHIQVKLPEIMKSVSRIDSALCDPYRPILIFKVVTHFNREISQLTNALNRELANYEFQASFPMGNQCKLSHHGLKRSKNYCLKDITIQTNFFLKIANALQSFRDLYPDGLQVQKITRAQFQLVFVCLVNTLMNKHTLQLDENLPPLLKVLLRRLEVEVIKILKESHEEVFALNFERTKSENSSKIRVAHFNTTVQNFIKVGLEKQEWLSDDYEVFDRVIINLIEHLSVLKEQVGRFSDDIYVQWRKCRMDSNLTKGTIAANLGEMKNTALVLAKSQSIQTSFGLFNLLIKALTGIQEDITAAIEKESAEKAEEALHFLEMEEENAENLLNAELAAQEEKEFAENEKKLEAEWAAKTAQRHAADAAKRAAALAVGAAAAASLQVDLAPKSILLPPSLFNTPSSQMLFDLSNEIARGNGLNAAFVVAPADITAQRMPAFQIAVHQHLYANHNLTAVFEMLTNSDIPADRTLLFQMTLKWGYLALEQSLATEHVKVYPKRFLRHQLNRLQTGLGMAVQNNWTKHAVSQTLYSRYPWHFKANGAKPFPLGLRCIREATSFVAKEFEAKAQTLMLENMVMQHAILIHHAKDKNDPHLKCIQDAFKTFQSVSQAVSAKEGDVKVTKETQTAANAAILGDLEIKFTTPMQKCNAALEKLSEDLKNARLLNDEEKILVIENAQKALLNARHHLVNILGAIGLLKRFPQQRFVHVLVDFIHSSGKDFAENVGAFLSIRAGKPQYTHSLATYMKEYELGKNFKAKDKKILADSDVHNGDKYPYKYFTTTSAKFVSPHMTLLSEFYKLSREAVLVGEGTAASGTSVKSHDCASKAVQFAKSIAEMACGLANKHF
jgi:hypothetical protein